MHNPGMLMDVTVAKGATFTQHVPEGWNGFAYVANGSGKISGTAVKAEQVRCHPAVTLCNLSRCLSAVTGLMQDLTTVGGCEARLPCVPKQMMICLQLY